MFGIAWGIVSITLMVAAGEGLRVGQAKVAEQFGKDIMIVFAGRTSMQAGGTRAGRPIRWLTGDYKIAQAQSPSCATIVPELGQSDTPVRSSYNSRRLARHRLAAAVRRHPHHHGRRGPLAQLGRRDARRGASPSSAATRRSSCSAAAPALGETIRIADFPFTVVGIMKHKEQDSSYDGQDISKVFIPFATIARDLPNKPPAIPDTVDRLLVSPRSVELHDDCKREFRTALGRVTTSTPPTRKPPASGTPSRTRRRFAR